MIFWSFLGLFPSLSFFCYFFHIFGHISGTTGPIGLKFFVRADFDHPVAHTKLQPLRLKDAEDIGWCVRNARGARGLQRTVAKSLTFFHFSTLVLVIGFDDVFFAIGFPSSVLSIHWRMSSTIAHNLDESR